jgi:elongator complex protein 2
MTDQIKVTCELLHHGAAANSSPKVIATIPSLDDSENIDDPSSTTPTTQLVYASHLMLNVAERRCVQIAGKTEYIWKVTQTLRTQTSTTAEMATAAANVSTLTAKRVITCVKAVSVSPSNSKTLVLVCGFSDGSLTSWHRDAHGHWEEHVLPNLKAQLEGRSITDLDGYCHGNVLSLIVCTSGGAHFLAFEGVGLIQGKQLIHTPCNVCKYQVLPRSSNNKHNNHESLVPDDGLGVYLVGTAAPRHNKIHVLTSSYENSQLPVYCGSLSGHEDWITCFDWITPPNNNASSNSKVSFLASGSQDAKIRLWKWVTTTNNMHSTSADPTVPGVVPESSDDDDKEENDDDDDEEEVIDGEARLEIAHGKCLLTSVYLEALLVGHEEMVTSVEWHPNPQPLYQQDLILLSGSMDRAIFIWSSTESDNGVLNVHKSAMDGVWTPIDRVGSAGGILGGSVGSSLLGFLNLKVEPNYGRWIMGHAYGGALHFFSSDTPDPQDNGTVEEQTSKAQWKAQPCLTGHFHEVTDLCWEASQGDYLMTVSNDQTCRIWAPTHAKDGMWIEIARPQVHGYNLSAVTSLSTSDHRDLIVTGADEKEIRVFNGTLSFLRMFEKVAGSSSSAVESTESRVERAYIPALGLTNKASSADGADEDTSGASKSSTSLLLEKDLGSISLWPEIRKLFGHNSEILRLTSTLTSRTCLNTQYSTPYFQEVLVASTTKARDVETANIRLWDLDYRCVQVLKGGHRSTVTALSFSPDGSYLASSGKDRRLCIWKRHGNDSVSPENDSDRFFLASAVDSSHKRIIWSVNFCPYSPSILASGSRDGNVKLWSLNDTALEDSGGTDVQEFSKFAPRQGVDIKDSAVTSLAFAPTKLNESEGLLAIGFEDGMLELWSVPIDPAKNTQPSLVTRFDPNCCHIGAVNKIAWKPAANASSGSLILASCSADCGCRIFAVKMYV